MHKNSFEDFSLTTKDSIAVRNLLIKKKIDKMWAYIDSLKLNISNFKEMEIICERNGVVLREWKR